MYLAFIFSRSTLGTLQATRQIFANPALSGLVNGSSSRAGVLVGVYFDIPSGKKIIIRPGTELVLAAH